MMIMMMIKTMQLGDTVCGIIKTIANIFIPFKISKVKKYSSLNCMPHLLIIPLDVVSVQSWCECHCLSSSDSPLNKPCFCADENPKSIFYSPRVCCTPLKGLQLSLDDLVAQGGVCAAVS